MAGTGTAGQGRAKPEWGTPAPATPKPKPKPKVKAPAAGGSRSRTASPPSTRKPTRKPKPKTKANAKAAAPAQAPRAKAPRAKALRAKPAAAPRTGARPSGRSPGGRSARARRLRKRYAIVYDTDGPRVRLGVCWFFLALLAVAIGPFPTAVVYGGAAAVAAAQTARCWRKRRPRPSDVMAAGGAGLITAGACFGAGGAGLGILVAVAAAFMGAASDVRSPNPRISDIGWTLQCALVPGIVGMSMVLLTRLDQGSALSLLLLVSAYETGDYLIGSGSTNPYEGPAAGVAAIVVITFIVSTLPISTLSFGEAWLFGGAIALLAPAGQLLGSALLPAADAPASALRRLDSLLIAAPVWAWGVGLVV